MSAPAAQAGHTPLPWCRGGTSFLSGVARVNIWGPTPKGKQSGNIVAKDLTRADAEVLLKSVNERPALLAQNEALRKCLLRCANAIFGASIYDGDQECYEAEEAARAALAQTKGAA